MMCLNVYYHPLKYFSYIYMVTTKLKAKEETEHHGSEWRDNHS